MNILRDHDLRHLNSFGFAARAERFCRVADLDELRAALAEARDQRWAVTPLGGGSNLLLTRDVPGLVLQAALPGIELLERRGDELLLRVGAGENWHALVERCIARGWHGLENLALIPGTAGAAPIQNIGAYGVELVDVFDSLEAVQIASGAAAEFNREECRFGYRDSVFKGRLAGQFAITAIRLRLSTRAEFNIGYGALGDALAASLADGAAPSARQVADAVIALRRSKLPDPAQLGNAGSFFHNPLVDAAQFAALRARYPTLPHYPQADGRVKLPAAWLVERAGWKGYREGAVGVHDRQAIVLVHYFDRGGGSGAQLLELAERIRADVQRRFGLWLQIEPRLL